MTTEPARLMNARRIGRLALVACASAALLACKPAAQQAAAPAAPSAAELAASAAQAEAQAKQAAEAERAASEVERLRKENAELKAKAAQPARPAPAVAPPAPAADQAANKEAKALAGLEPRSLPVSARFSGDGVTIQLANTDITRQWRFDVYGSSSQIEEAARGNRFVIASATLTSKKKDPNLPGVGVYRVDGKTLVKVGDLRYQFARWDDRDSYVGNKPDLNNDFSRRPDVRFSLGAQIDADQLKGPIYLVATREGCHRSNFKRERTPQIHYDLQACPSLKPLLTVSDFKDGQIGVLKVLGAGKR